MPRTRGGLPVPMELLPEGWPFAPHTRGSTCNGTIFRHTCRVCPAHAGVYLQWNDLPAHMPSLPRTRGGLPAMERSSGTHAEFAPHTRGSTQQGGQCADCHIVCPAHAGVYPKRSCHRRSQACLPRTRGGLPSRTFQCSPSGMFAPHTRGSTAPGAHSGGRRAVCPAHAGVLIQTTMQHMRIVFCPAHAGVYLQGISPGDAGDSLPRTRGGLPFKIQQRLAFLKFAPHTRGSTFQNPATPGVLEVCPAHAGVYLSKSSNAWRS